ncbi:MAG: 50S ribosome-binding GTPase, partial [Acholeplasmataceae bacterium]|nr:50S ribosome-binding GTPase [Acholeplasmataceae bacterium]
SYPVYRYQPDAHFVYIINQIDLLPRSTNLDKLVEKLTQKARSLNVPFQDIILMSAKNMIDIENLKKYLSSYKHKNIYLLGVQNSGKTTIFKALTNQTKALAFKKAGLTQEALSQPFGNQIIYDMPGLYQEGYLHQLLPYEIYKNLIPDTEMKPRIYQIKDQQALFIEGLISIVFTGQEINAVFYGDQSIRIHKTNAKRVKDLFLNKEEHFKVFVKDYEEKALRIPRGKTQITFADMGFLHVVGPMHLKITYPKGMHLSMTEATFQ